jgi:hypothetical protein
MNRGFAIHQARITPKKATAAPEVQLEEGIQAILLLQIESLIKKGYPVELFDMMGFLWGRYLAARPPSAAPSPSAGPVEEQAVSLDWLTSEGTPSRHHVDALARAPEPEQEPEILPPVEAGHVGEVPARPKPKNQLPTRDQQKLFEQLGMPFTIAFCYLAATQLRLPLLPHDFRVMANSGAFPYFTVHRRFKNPAFIAKSCPADLEIERRTLVLSGVVGVHYAPSHAMLLTRFVGELQLPALMLTLSLRLLQLHPPVPGNWEQLPYLRAARTGTLAYLVVVAKLVWGLDEHWRASNFEGCPSFLDWAVASHPSAEPPTLSPASVDKSSPSDPPAMSR